MGSGVSVPPELPFHSSTLYNGKVLEPLSAVNEEQLKAFECGEWSDVVPEHLSQIIQQPGRYKEAIGIINTVSKTHVRVTAYWQLLPKTIGLTLLTLFLGLGIPLILHELDWADLQRPVVIMALVFLIATQTWLGYVYVVRYENLRIVCELQKVIGQANVLLFEEKILMGTVFNSKLLLVHVSLDGCRQELSALSQDPQLFHKYIEEYSNSYVCCLARRYFSFKPISSTCPLQGALCFCQYVIRRLHMKKCCFCCRNQNSYSVLQSSGEQNFV